MELVNPLAESYSELFTTPNNHLLQQVYEHTLAIHPHAHMQSSAVQGRFLSFITNILQPKFVLEVGTFTGYSALCIAESLTDDAILHTIELREADAVTASQNFSKSIKNKQIHLHLGNALNIIPQLPCNWDLVFIDADKTGYIDYYELIVPRLNPGGIIIADNVLFHGQVLAEPLKGKSAKAIHAFNQHVANDDRVEQVMLTMRDGILLIKKK